MKVGDLVRMRPAVAPPKLYGIGIIVKVTGNNGPDRRCFVKWPTMPDREPKGCGRYALELVSGSR